MRSSTMPLLVHSAEEMLPAVAQGAIGIACREGDDRSGEA